MGEKIAMGFHATVDFELKWDTEKFVRLISEYQIRDHELDINISLDSERNMVIIALAHMKQGSGAEFTPVTNELCKHFAEHFHYQQTLGGTATRAAIAISKLGFRSELSICCFNRYVRLGLPQNIHCFSNIGEGREEVYPHVVFTYPSNIRICVNDIDFVTPRENRIMFSNDEESKNMAVSQGFLPCMSSAKVFLLGCFSEVLDFGVLRYRMLQTKELLKKRNPDTILIFEDGCYIQKQFRIYVHKELMKCGLGVLSMNEDEIQELVGRRFNILDARMVLEAFEQCAHIIGVPLLVVHTSKWAAAYGDNAKKLRQGLEAGICLSATRFCYGNDYGMEDFHFVSSMPVNKEGEVFCKILEHMAENKVCVLPTRNLCHVHNPTVVGLGDCFAGGLALGLAENNL